jgi:thiol-disulfide isomerase/thioredoxin
MRLLPWSHPTLDELRALQSPSAEGHQQARIAAHVARCAICQASLSWLADLSVQVAILPAAVPSLALRNRILSSRTAGERTILPTSARPVQLSTLARETARTPRKRWAAWGTAAAAAMTVTVVSFVSGPRTIEAAATAGELVLSTDTPRPGEAITVRYRAGSTLRRARTLRLRARVRTASGEGYVTGVPVVSVATLTREPGGDFVGRFTLPDSIVFAALAVEDSAASEIDDHGGRTWTVWRGTTARQRTLDAMQQQANDLLGRNWAGVFSSAREMVAAYPDSIGAWSWLRSSQSWMGLPEDSIAVLHRPALRRLDAQYRPRTSIDGNAMGLLAFYAKQMDTTVSAYWRARNRQGFPNGLFPVREERSAIMNRFWQRNDTLPTLKALDSLFEVADAVGRKDILSYGFEVAMATKDSATMLRWGARQVSTDVAGNSSGSEASRRRSVALLYSTVPALRTEAMRLMRGELARLNQALQQPVAVAALRTRDAIIVDPRALDETQAEYRDRLDRDLRATYAALGRVLVRAGQHRAALDTLALASAKGWNLNVFNDVRAASLAAGDSATAVVMSARIAVDPRTKPERLEAMTAFAAKRVGSAAWQAELDKQRQEYRQRVMTTVRLRGLPATVPLMGLDGSASDLRRLANGQVTVVAFWSRFCGPAIMSMPDLHVVAAKLSANGVRTVMVVEETERSPELTAFIKDNKITLPMYLDATKSASQAFNQWGTPNYYVLDAEGRILFDVTADTDLLLMRAEAARLAASSR